MPKSGLDAIINLTMTEEVFNHEKDQLKFDPIGH